MKKIKRSVKIIIAIVLVIVLLLASGTLFYLSKLNLLQFSNGKFSWNGSIDENDSDVIDEASRMDEAIAELDEKASVDATGDIYTDKNYFNILLIGTDERSEDFSNNARGDTCMIMSLGKKDGSMKLISLERGMGMPILNGKYKGQYDWLTHTFRYGGADLMMREVRECFKVDIERYVRVNFTTFEKGIESVGGIDISLTAVEAKYVNTYTGRNIYTAGSNHLDSTAALVYARCREVDSDWHRIERQRNVIQAVVTKTKDLSVTELNDLLNSVLPLVQTNLTRLEITELLLLAPKYRGVTIQQMTVPISGSYGGMRGMGGRSLFSVDFDSNAKALREFIYGVAVNGD